MSLLGQVRKGGNPLIDGTRVTLVWEGQSAPRLIDDLHGWTENPQRMTRASAGVWRTSFDLARNAYLEYAFYDPQTGTHLHDPFNRRRVSNGLGGHNHFFYMPEADGPTPLVHLPAGGMKGRITHHTVATEWVTTNKRRRVYMYHPPTAEPVPLLVVYDGLDYLRHGRLAQILENLIAQKRIRPLAAAFVQNAREGARSVEYGCSEATLVFVARDVLGLARQHLNLLDPARNPGSYGVLGASLGGLMAVYTAMRLPHLFGRALSQAGSFEHSGYEGETIVIQMARHFPRPPVRIWMSCGAMDFLVKENRSIVSLLRRRRYDLTYVENGGAHNYTTWRDSLAQGLETLFTP
jgi:enterochelin esterase family protein